MADFEQDYIMRVIRDMVRFISTLALGKIDPAALSGGDRDAADPLPHAELYAELMKLVKKGDVGMAEDMLFDRLDEKDTSYLETGLTFFMKLAEMGDEALERCDYSREEVADGIIVLGELYGVVGLEQFQ